MFDLAASNSHITKTQKNEYLKQNPSHGALFNEENEIEDIDVGSEVTKV